MSTEPEQGPRGGVAGSSALMFAGTLVSRILGMVKAPLLLGAAIGINFGAANAFAVANKLPNLIYMLLAGGVLNAILVPQIVRAIKDHPDGGRTYVNRLLTVGMAGLALVTVLLTLASPLLISLYAASLSPQWYDLAVTFGYWCIPQLFFYGTYTLFGQVLNARNVFGPYMWAPALNNLVAIGGLVAYLLVFGGTAAVDVDDAGVWGISRTALLAGTATLGIVAQAVVLLVPLYRSGFRYRPQWGLRGSGLGSASRMAMWVFAALAANQAAYVVVSNAAAYAFRAGDGAADVAGNAAYDTAFLVYTLPTSLVTVSLVTALFTRMSANAAAQKLAAVRSDLSKGLRTVSAFTVLAAVLLMVTALPVIRVVAATVGYAEVQSIARVTVAMAPGLVAVGIFTMCQRVFYAFEDARGLFRLQIPMVVLLATGAAASMLLPARWTVVGIGVAMTLSSCVGALVTYLGLRLHLRTIDGGRVLRTHLRLLLAAVPTGLLGWGLLRLAGTDHELTVLGALWRILLVSVVSGAIYVLVLRVLRVEELNVLGESVGRLLLLAGRRVPSPVGPFLVRLGTALAPGTAARRPDDPGPPPPPPDGGGPPAGAGPGPDTAGPAPAPPAPDGSSEPATRETPARMDAASGAPLRTLGSDAAGETGTGGTGLNQRTDGAGEHALLGERYELGPALETTVGGVEHRRARDRTLEADVEVLVLPPTGSKVAEVLDAARRAALVDDHRLLRVLDVGSDERAAYVVTGRVTGPDLAALSAPAGLPPEQARAVIGEAAAALEAARRHGVRHLALRPESVHVTPDGEVLVTGLGTDAVLLGTAEQPDDSPLTTARRDATDLVHLLYLALTGTSPEEGSPSPREVRSEVPGDLDDVCARTLREDGPRSTGELLRLLAPWPTVDSALARAGAAPPPPAAPPVSAQPDDGDAAAPTAETAAAGTATAGVVAAGAAGAAAAAGSGAVEAATSRLTRPGKRPAWAPLRPAGPSTAEPAVQEEAPPPPPGSDAPPPPEEPDERDTDEAAADSAPAADDVPAAPAPDEPIATLDVPAVTAPAASESADEPPAPEPPAPEPPAPEPPAPEPPAPEPPRSMSWKPHPPAQAAPAPQFGDILSASSAPTPGTEPEHGPSHTRGAGVAAAAGAFGSLARSAASAIGSGARRAAEGTRESVGSAVASGRQRAATTAESLRARKGTTTTVTEEIARQRAEDGISEIDGPEVPFADRRMDPTPVVLVGLIALVLILVLLSVRTLFAPPDPVSLPTYHPAATATEEPTTPPEEEQTTEEPAEEETTAQVTPVIAELAPLDPEGDGLENPELTPRAMDDDPESFWRSRSYVDPSYGMKSGIGLLVTLEETATVSRVEMDLMGEGGMVEIRATSGEEPTDGEPLVAGEMGPDTVFEFDDPVETDSLVLWFPQLPVAESDGLNRIELAELRVG
ncbi:lipid II flippase MurJ [Georgenia alba]|uniref:Lipid II flippase MurJ n=1 Tax=Georgenia alba TaxID=2233858 RepID=A0ABW2Q8K1_9MICO